MTQTSEIAVQSTEDLWRSFEKLNADWEKSQRQEDECWTAYKEASTKQREAWDASQAAYAAYRTAIDGGSK